MFNKLSGVFYRKTTAIVFLILLQLAVLVLSIWRMARFFPYVYLGLLLISMVVLVGLINSDTNPSYKLAWCIPILILPVFGGIFYLLFGTSKVNSNLKKNREQQQKFKTQYLHPNQTTLDELSQISQTAGIQATYVASAGYPLYRNESCEYFPLGEDKFSRMLAELQKAESFIFLEYFIIAQGSMWDGILEILKEKAAQGVEVRVIFDDCGSLGLLPPHYEKELQSYGINCRIFNPLRPSLAITMNNRDHRKIMVIDGKVGFTGGINIGDEYINQKDIHGHWKDSAVMFTGQAVNTLTGLFFEMWNLILPDDRDVSAYFTQKTEVATFDGYLQPYGSDPFGEDTVGENVYLNLINKATREILILTPYLIIDNELTTALCLAAKNGVCVKILTPHVADKWYVHLMTKASYPPLLRAGVQIYEYTPGFVHAKVFVIDGEVATVGTINMDYRSLYLHFECGAILYHSKTVSHIQKDCHDTFSKSTPVTMEDCKKIRWYERMFQRMIRVFSPLM